jgi:RimJ/RimL family protein N-acetyltransferase
VKYPSVFPVLATDRLLLRETAPRDVEAVFEMESDPVAMRFWSRPPMQEIAEAQLSVERSMTYFGARVGIRWSITRPGEDRLLGHVSLFNFHEPSDRGDIGYGLMRAHWGQGIMNEALTAVIDYAFGPLELRRLEADIDPANAASLRAVERLGFRREGLLKERWQVGETISDSVLLGLLAREWRARESDDGRR